ncbi:MAG TPA: AMP-binding protein [bacterium]|nr:AMP-binding protein [bacterium]
MSDHVFLREYPKAAIEAKGLTLSYRRLMNETERYAAQIGVAPGDRVAIYAENSAQWAVALYGAWRIGAVPVPIDALAVADEAAYILADCRPAVLFCSHKTAEKAAEAQRLSGHTPKILNLDELGFTEREAREPAPFPAADPDALALILYTSGTTGSPKGVMLTFGNLIANIRAVTEEVPFYNREERVMVLLPLHHIFPIMGTLVAPLYVGATLVYCPSLAPTDIMDTLSVGRITIIIGVPRFYAMIVKGIRDKLRASLPVWLIFRLCRLLLWRRLSKIIFKEVQMRFGGTVKHLIAGGAALGIETARDLAALGFDVYEGYGMTETAPIITFPRIGRMRLGSTGQTLFPGGVRIEDGEILASGPNVMRGYWNRPEETAAIIRDGWLHTGDAGYLDRDGYLFITGRVKEIIVLPNGKNVNPDEVEEKLRRDFPAVSEAGVYLKNGGLAAIFVPDPSKIPAGAHRDLREYFRYEVVQRYNDKATPYKRLLHFTLSSEPLPRTRLGKLRRFQLPELGVEARRPRDKAVEPDTAEYGAIKRFIVDETGKDPHPDDHIEIDLGLDSLSRLKLQEFIRVSCGVALRDGEIAGTVRTLAERVAASRGTVTEQTVGWRELLLRDEDIDLPRSAWFHAFLKNMFRLWLYTYFRFRANGRDNVPEPPFILAANHQSFIDGLFVVTPLADRLVRETFFFAKGKHFKAWWRRYLARRDNIIIMEEGGDLRDAIARMAAVLKKKKSIIIFPEGTRTRDGHIGNFRETFAILAAELKVPVVPVAIRGAFEAFPRGRFIPRPWRSISVTYLPQITPDGRTYQALAAEVRDAIAAELGKTAPTVR